MKFVSEKAVNANKKLSDAYGELCAARGKYADCKRELAETLRGLFEEKVAKPGEKITSASGVTYFYEGIRHEYDVEVICHPMKKDGTPSKAVRYVYLSNFVESI